MASLNITIWSNESGAEVQNNSSQLKFRTTVQAENVFVPEYVSIVLAALGLPGNLFVIAVYVRNMTSSTRVYMFALAVADTIICLGGILLGNARYGMTLQFILTLFGDFGLNFEVHLLAFVSTERLMAVCRPHQFNRSATRAKVILSIIAVVTFCGATLMAVGDMWNYWQIHTVIPMIILVVCVTVMIVCYVLIAAKLLHAARCSRNSVGVVNSTQTNTTATSTATTNNTAGITTAKIAKTYKGVSLLFIITFVFIACWAPRWLYYAGVPVPNVLHETFVINSIVNPVIYCAASPVFRKDAAQFCRKTLSKLKTCAT